MIKTVNSDDLAMYDKYDGDFGLMDERWADPSDQKKITSESMMILSEYVNNLKLMNDSNVESCTKDNARRLIKELELKIDGQVITELGNRFKLNTKSAI